MSDYINAKREIANQQAAKAARIEVAAMVERERQRAEAAANPAQAPLNYDDIDAKRIAFIGAREINDGYKTDVYLLPDVAGGPLIAVPYPHNTADAVTHFNEMGEGDVALIKAQGCGLAVNAKTVSELRRTPDAITSALVFWNSSDAPQGLPARLRIEEIEQIEAEINLAKLQAIAKHNLVQHGAPAKEVQLNCA